VIGTDPKLVPRFTTGEVAQALGVPRRTLLAWRAKGLASWVIVDGRKQPWARRDVWLIGLLAALRGQNVRWRQLAEAQELLCHSTPEARDGRLLAVRRERDGDGFVRLCEPADVIALMIAGPLVLLPLPEPKEDQ